MCMFSQACLNTRHLTVNTHHFVIISPHCSSLNKLNNSDIRQSYQMTLDRKTEKNGATKELLRKTIGSNSQSGLHVPDVCV